MKIKILLISCLVLTILAWFIGIGMVSSTHFWDSKRVQKSLAVNVAKGDSENAVVAWLTSSGISYKRIANKGIGFDTRSEVKRSKLAPTGIGFELEGNTKQGLLPDDLYWTTIYFFFDEQGKLIKYDVKSAYAGL